jgi:DNA-binding NarL/FixJ family response regulator
VRAVERDLRRQYGERYRVLQAPSGQAALGLLERLAARGDPVALLLVDQRMPEMTGVELLAQAMPLAPSAKRVLLTAYADTDAAIRAINRGADPLLPDEALGSARAESLSRTSTTCSRTGRRTTARRTPACASSALGGRRARTRCATSSAAT